MSASSSPSLSAELGSRRLWLPVLAGLFLGALIFTFWHSLKRQEQTDLQNKVRIEAESLASHIDADLRTRIACLQRLSRRWEVHQGLSQQEFSIDARAYLRDMPGFHGIEWVSRDHRVRWAEPLEGNERVLNVDLALEKNQRVAMQRAQDHHTFATTSPMDLPQGGKGFLVFVPVYTNGEHQGWLVAVLVIQEWLDQVLNSQSVRIPWDYYRASAQFDEQLVYRQSGWDEQGQSGTPQTAPVSLPEHRLTIQLLPTAKFIRSNETQLPTLTAVFGALLAALATLTVHLLQKTLADAARKHAAKIALERVVHQREQAQHELQRALVRMDLATKAGAVGVFTWDLSNDQLLWNDRMFELYGVPPDVYPTYDTWRDALHPSDAQYAEALLREAVAGRAVFETEFRILHPNGVLRHIKAAARVERDHENKPRFVTGLNWDITESKRKQQALVKSEQQVRLLLNSTAEAIYGIDRTGNCTFANPAAARMLGYADPDVFIGKNMHELTHHSYPDGRPMPKEACKIYRAFTQGKGEHGDDEAFWRADGTSFPVEYWSYPQWENDELQGAVVTFVNITIRTRPRSCQGARHHRRRRGARRRPPERRPAPPPRPMRSAPPRRPSRCPASCPRPAPGRTPPSPPPPRRSKTCCAKAAPNSAIRTSRGCRTGRRGRRNPKAASVS